MNERSTHGDVALPAHHQPTKISQPGKCALHLPPAFIAPQLPPVLERRLFPILPMGTDQVNAPLGQPLPQRVRVTRLVIDQPLRTLARTPSPWTRDRNGLQVGSISCTAAGDAASKRFPRGTPWPSTTTIHFVPLPRLVFPTHAPLFSRGQNCHRRRLPTQPVGRAHRVGPGKRPRIAARYRALPSPASVATRCSGRDIASAGLASVLPCAKPTACPQNRGDWQSVSVPLREKPEAQGARARFCPTVHR
jgi:hypothetical protein